MSLSSITGPKFTALFKQVGAFYAFSQKQLDESKQEGVEYVSIGGGLICPKEQAKTLVDGMSDISKKGIAEDLAVNGRRKIIIRELYNYECFYVGCIDDCVDALVSYGIERDEISKVYAEVLPTVDF